MARSLFERMTTWARLFALRPDVEVVLMTAYGLGLRVGELCRLRPADIDAHPDRMCVRIVQGKGAKDRYVPLPADVPGHGWRGQHY